MSKNLPKPKASTQEHLDIEDIADDMVVFKTGWVGLVISVTSLNFDLLSEAEQDATIYAYGAFLNSLSFPLQVLIRSKRADITAYFNSLSEAEKAQPNPDLKRQIQKYEEFLTSIVHEKTILDKKFYLVVNYSPLESGLKGISQSPKSATTTKGKAQLLATAKSSLYPRRDHIFKQMARIGLTTRQLTTKELIELYYDIYNPAPTETQRVILDTASYTTPIVEPAVEIPAPAPQNATQDSLLSPESLPPVENKPFGTPANTPTIQEPLEKSVGPVLQPRLAPDASPQPTAPLATNQTPAPGTQAALDSLKQTTAEAAKLMRDK